MTVEKIVQDRILTSNLTLEGQRFNTTLQSQFQWLFPSQESQLTSLFCERQCRHAATGVEMSSVLRRVLYYSIELWKENAAIVQL